MSISESFKTISANDLETVEMIAGDSRTFKYEVYNAEDVSVDLINSEISLIIFNYGDPAHITLELNGTLSGSTTNLFSVKISGSSTQSMEGIYQQQVKIIDELGQVHIPSQGKIVIFPTVPTS